MSIPKTFLYDWIANGTGAEIRDYIPPDTDMETAVNQLRAGLSAKHLAGDAIETAKIADDAVTGAKIAAADKFESVITVDDEIQQTALEDLSAATYVVLVLAGS